MTVPTNTWTSFATAGNREDIADEIYDISPKDTPFFANIGKGNATNRTHQWFTDVLDTPGTNAHIEGDDFIADALTAATGHSNVTQIFKKQLAVSNTNRALDFANGEDQFTYQLLKKSDAIKRDIEWTLLGNQAPVAGTASVAAQLRPLVGWFATNIVDATSGFTAGTTTAAATYGSTQVAFTERMLKNCLKSVYNAGGNPDYIFAGPGNKQAISELAGSTIANFRRNTSAGGTVDVTVDIYKSDYGTVTVMPDRFMDQATSCNVFIIDTDYWKMSVLRPMVTEDLPQTGDSTRGQIIYEATLEASNEAASGLITDLTSGLAD